MINNPEQSISIDHMRGGVSRGCGVKSLGGQTKMRTVKSILFGFGVLGFAVVGLSSTAQAVSCPGSLSPGGAQYTLNPASAVTCGNSGTPATPTIPSGYTLIDKYDTSGDQGPTLGALTITFDLPQDSTNLFSGGHWLVASSVLASYHNLLLALVDSNNNPNWAVFTLTSVLTGTWDMLQSNCSPPNNLDKCKTSGLNLSHAILYGISGGTINEGGPPPNPVPLPPAFLLFGAGLMGLSVLSRRRRKA
jgi:hypothetical protein